MINKALTLSLVIPVYNEEHHLETCLRAIAAQTVMPLEVIVVDNNCTDGTVAVARRFSFVRVVKEPQQGIVYARNRGFNVAKGTIIGRIDADTILPPNWNERITRFYDHGRHANQALTGGCYFYNIRLPHFWGWWQGQIAFRTNRLLLGHYITFGSNMALPAALWKEVLPQTCRRTDIHEDLDLAIHLHRAGAKITYQETLRVGISMKRVRSDRADLWPNLMMWPQTLRVHGRWQWVFGWLGAAMLFSLFPFVSIMEAVAQLFGKPPLPKD